MADHALLVGINQYPYPNELYPAGYTRGGHASSTRARGEQSSRLLVGAAHRFDACRYPNVRFQGRRRSNCRTFDGDRCGGGTRGAIHRDCRSVHRSGAALVARDGRDARQRWSGPRHDMACPWRVCRDSRLTLIDRLKPAKLGHVTLKASCVIETR